MHVASRLVTCGPRNSIVFNASFGLASSTRKNYNMYEDTISMKSLNANVLEEIKDSEAYNNNEKKAGGVENAGNDSK